jgi:hypothetical protein
MSRTPFALALGAALIALPADAAEFTYNFVACGHSKQTAIEAGPEFTAIGFEQWGLVANSTTKDWENATTKCVGYLRIVGGKPVGKGVCKWVQAGGDTAFGEFEYPVTGEPSFTWLHGTGKLKGIQGGGSFKQISNARPVEPGTGQSCRQDWGRFTTP